MSPKKRLGVTVISTVWSNVSLKTIVVVAEPQNSPFHTTANLGSRSVTEPCSRHLPEEETEAQRHALASSGAEPGTLAQLAAGARFFLLKVGLASHGRPDGPELPKALTFMTAKAGGHRDSTRESMVSSKETGGGGGRSTTHWSPALLGHSKFPALQSYVISPRRSRRVCRACWELQYVGGAQPKMLLLLKCQAQATHLCAPVWLKSSRAGLVLYPY